MKLIQFWRMKKKEKNLIKMQEEKEKLEKQLKKELEEIKKQLFTN